MKTVTDFTAYVQSSLVLSCMPFKLLGKYKESTHKLTRIS